MAMVIDTEELGQERAGDFLRARSTWEDRAMDTHCTAEPTWDRKYELSFSHSGADVGGTAGNRTLSLWEARVGHVHLHWAFVHEKARTV